MKSVRCGVCDLYILDSDWDKHSLTKMHQDNVIEQLGNKLRKNSID